MTRPASRLPRRQPAEETEYYKEYNSALIRKLEDKMLQLEEAESQRSNP